MANLPLHTSEHDSLLGREPVIAYGAAARRLISESRVLVTGAGGSIGSELVRQVAALGPKELFLLDRDESLLHQVQLETFGDGQLVHERTILADVRDRRRLTALMCEARPDVVFHAAAHKHLSILERYPSEATRTNVLGTDNVIRACRSAGVGRLIFVSTDKAAAPTSVLGVSKRIGELMVHGGSTESMRTASVRFGNVLGSRGSFLHTLDHQLRTGMAVTVTDPDAERFFMSIPEAAALVIEAAVGANQGETYLLDMGEPVRIVDMVRRYAEATGFGDPRIEFTGMCSGEKITETLLDPSEVRFDTHHERIWRVPDLGIDRLSWPRVQRLYAAALEGNEDLVRQRLWSCLGAEERSLASLGAAAQ